MYTETSARCSPCCVWLHAYIACICGHLWGRDMWEEHVLTPPFVWCRHSLNRTRWTIRIARRSAACIVGCMTPVIHVQVGLSICLPIYTSVFLSVCSYSRDRGEWTSGSQQRKATVGDANQPPHALVIIKLVRCLTCVEESLCMWADTMEQWPSYSYRQTRRQN